MVRLNKLLNPEIFQGNNKKKHYFEGWYFKITDSTEEYSYAIIPGISMGSWDSHAFIQVLDMNHNVHYFYFELNEFEYNEYTMEFMIGKNYFSKSRLRLNLVKEDFKLQGDLYFSNIMEYPKTLLCPGVMGPFLYIPWMECYHDIVHIQNEISGHLRVSGKSIDFNEGIGYIEKDWGKSMPDAWIWTQCNHFQPDDVSLSLSVARARCMGGGFTGFIGLFRYRDRIFMFTTYSGAWIDKIINYGNRLRITLKDCRFRLDVSITYSDGGRLKAAVGGLMSRGITESINTVIKLRFSDRTGRVLYEGIGTNCGLEIVE